MKLTNLKGTPGHGLVLVEYFNKNRKIKFNSLELYSPVKKYDFGNSKDHTANSNILKHSERKGVVISVCDNIRLGSYDFYSKIEVKKGDKVWFNAHAFINSKKFTYRNRKFVLIDYKRLYMKEYNKNYKMLNGYVLAEREPKPLSNGLIVIPEKQYFGNIFRIYKRGMPVKYVDNENIYSDFKDLYEGELVLTRQPEYPKLEEIGHKNFSNKNFYCFQTKEIFAKIKLNEK